MIIIRITYSIPNVFHFEFVNVSTRLNALSVYLKIGTLLEAGGMSSLDHMKCYEGGLESLFTVQCAIPFQKDIL